jgi:AGCS family alanine or glycine:cation symporter
MTIESIASSLASWVWGLPLIVLLFGTHLFLTVRTGFIQRHMGRAIRISMSRKKEGEGDVSQFGALMTALAATIGTGNIIGVAGAIAAGGPGAVLWMWLTGVFGIATKYSEAVLAVKYRVQMPDGSFAGGPMYALERGLGMKWLGMIFAVFTAVAAFGIGNMAQANSVVEMLKDEIIKPDAESVTIMRWVAGSVMAALTAAVILGGVKSIAKVCEFFVPVMAVVYVVGCVFVLVKNFGALPQALADIWHGAWNGTAAVGGFTGAVVSKAIQQGIARGLFSNESGLGSAPIVAAAAQTRNPVRQALVSSTGTFWDTVVVCLMTGLVIVSSGHWKEGLPKSQLTAAAFGELHTIGPIFLLFGLLTFVFSTILGWSYYGERAAEYLFGPKAVKPYRFAWVAAVLIGSVHPAKTVWDFSDAANGLMAVPNLIALLLLSGVVASETRQYRSELTGKEDSGP